MARIILVDICRGTLLFVMGHLQQPEDDAPTEFDGNVIFPFDIEDAINADITLSQIDDDVFNLEQSILNHIPGPSVYESRGKGMSALLKEKADKYNYEYPDSKKKYKSSIRVKKLDDPAPTTYEFPKAKDQTA